MYNSTFLANILQKYLEQKLKKTYKTSDKLYKMPKRTREDAASEALIQQLLHEDLKTTPESLESEKLAIEMTYEDAIDRLRREFGNPEELDERKALLYKQKKEYELGLKNDRLKQLKERTEKYKEEEAETAAARERVQVRAKRRRVISEDIATIKELAGETCYRKLGKIRHLQKTLLDKQNTFTPEQREQYDLVLDELKKKGHRVLKQSK